MARYARIRDREARECYKLFYDESLMKRNAACNVCFSLLLFCGIPSSVLYGEMCSRVQEMQQDVAQRISDPPGGVQSRNHALYFIFTQLRIQKKAFHGSLWDGETVIFDLFWVIW